MKFYSFSFLLDVIFFWDIIFLFLINLGDCSFLVVICHFFVLIEHHSLIKTYE